MKKLTRAKNVAKIHVSADGILHADGVTFINTELHLEPTGRSVIVKNCEFCGPGRSWLDKLRNYFTSLIPGKF